MVNATWRPVEAMSETLVIADAVGNEHGVFGHVLTQRVQNDCLCIFLPIGRTLHE